MMLPLFLAAALSVDAQNHSVSFEVISQDPGSAAPVEFLVAGPGSDHDYESLFLSVAPVADLARAFERAGLPLGQPLDYRACRFWPVGAEVEFDPPLWTLLRDTRDERKAPVVYTGGTRATGGLPEAATNMPLAVFALYDCPQSLFQFDDALSQSATYGRFVPAAVIPAGERRTLTVRWKGTPPPAPTPLKLEPGKLPEAFAALKAQAAKGELLVIPDFSPDLTLAEAAEAAAALAVLDSPAVKIGGLLPGQFFYRSFLPLEKWRDRTERLTQPFELRLTSPSTSTSTSTPSGDGRAALGQSPSLSLTVIKEDWTSDPDSLDPKLVITENAPLSRLADPSAKQDTVLIFAPRATPLSTLYSLRVLFSPRLANIYLYAD